MKITPKTEKILKISLSVMTGVVALQLMVLVWNIFLTGGKVPYTESRIATRLYLACISFVPWLILAVANAVLVKEKPIKLKAYISVSDKLSRLKARLPLGIAEEKQKERKRLMLRCCIVCILLALAGGAALLIPSFDGYFGAKFFQSHVEAERLVYLSVLTAYAVVFGVWTFNRLEQSQEEEIVILKEALAEQAKSGEKVAKTQEKKQTLWDKICNKLPFLKSEKSTLYVRIAVGVVGVTLFVVGIFNGGMGDVLNKAVKICEQCIGLG